MAHSLEEKNKGNCQAAGAEQTFVGAGAVCRRKSKVINHAVPLLDFYTCRVHRFYLRVANLELNHLHIHIVVSALYI